MNIENIRNIIHEGFDSEDEPWTEVTPDEIGVESKNGLYVFYHGTSKALAEEIEQDGFLNEGTHVAGSLDHAVDWGKEKSNGTTTIVFELLLSEHEVELHEDGDHFEKGYWTTNNQVSINRRLSSKEVAKAGVPKKGTKYEVYQR